MLAKKLRKLKLILLFFSAFLYVILPFLRHSSIFLNPKTSTAKININKPPPTKYEVVIEYEYNGTTYETAFSQEFVNKNKSTIKIIFEEDNPENIILFTFFYLYFRVYMALPFVLMMIIFAVFLTDKQISKKIM